MEINNKPYQEAYEKYAKEMVDKFSDMCSIKNEYLDYCNKIQELNPGVFFNFRNPNMATVIDLNLSHKMDTEMFKNLIKSRKEEAKKWLSDNLLTYEEFAIELKMNMR